MNYPAKRGSIPKQSHPFFDTGGARNAIKARKLMRRFFGTELTERVMPFVEIFLPGVTPTFCKRNTEGFYEYRTDGITLSFPGKLRRTTHIAAGYPTWLREKYRLKGFVEVEPNDCVVDCGAFAGGFAIGVASRAGTVHAIEHKAATYLMARPKAALASSFWTPQIFSPPPT